MLLVNQATPIVTGPQWQWFACPIGLGGLWSLKGQFSNAKDMLKKQVNARLGKGPHSAPQNHQQRCQPDYKNDLDTVLQQLRTRQTL